MDHCVSQFQYNYLDVHYQAGSRGFRYAASRGVSVVIMEGLRGGALAHNIPPAVHALWGSYPHPTSPVATGEGKARTPADWALQWLWNQPEVSTVLSGMSTMDQVEGNLSSAAVSGVHMLSENDLQLIERVREKYRALCPIPCTRCAYCMPCPNGVNIPRNFDIYNDGSIYDKADWARSEYQNWFAPDERADKCIACLDCEQKCPQNIRISEWMPVVHSVLGEGRPYVSSL
jgi:predicted aldo/keto reductase-like oxidoreductase